MKRMTAEAFLSREQDELVRTELAEGCLVVLPQWTVKHQYAAGKAMTQLHAQLTGDSVAVMGVYVDLELVPPDEPGTVRRPDGVVLSREGFDRAIDQGLWPRASDVHAVIEVLTPGQTRTDLLLKRHDYAEAGIPHYWVIDLEPRVTLRQYHGSNPYWHAPVVSGSFTTEEPTNLTIDLDALVLTR